MTQTSLVADNITVSRGNLVVLDDVSFTVEQGSVFALLGGNGAGKSTTLLTFLGFISPTSGKVLVNNIDVSKNLTTARSVIAYLPEAATLYEHLNAYENLLYFLKLSGLKIGLGEIDLALDKVSLPGKARKNKLQTYSKGMRQKVGIAVALAKNAEVIFMDEPTSGLDPKATSEFTKICKELAAMGKVIFMATHDIFNAVELGTTIGIMKKGVLVQQLKSKDINADKLNQIYLETI